DKTIATVSSIRVVTGVMPGTATITATVDGKSYTCEVTVKNASATATTLKFKTVGGGTFTLGESKAKISFKLYATSANVKVSILKVSTGTNVYKKTYTKCTKDKTYSFTWDGTNTSGKTVAATDYVVVVKAGSTKTTSASLSLTKQSTTSLKSLYETVLKNVKAGKYTFPSLYGSSVEEYDYFTADMDGDGVQELIVGARFVSDAFYWYDCIIYDVESNAVRQISGDICVLNAFIPASGSGFYASTDFSRGTGVTSVQLVTVKSSAIVIGSTSSVSYSAMTSFTNTNKAVTWTEITDLSGLDNVQ
ncbi:MAG: hypothetical protein LUF30_12075, partial [Lachnospiraceae bacterium]|nr:hypothetical protein [Lachnospiraceae bacterium]